MKDANQEQTIKRVSFYQNGAVLYELIRDPKEEKNLLLGAFNTLLGEFSVTNEFDTGVCLLKPIQDKANLSRIVKLPTGIQEYSSFENLREEIEMFIGKYLFVSPRYLKLATYYVILTWVYDKFETIPYLRALGDYGTGKSRFLKVLGNLCYKSIFTSGSATVSPIFRLIEQYRGTLIMDEADLRYSDTTSDLIKILNCGYTRDIPVIRTEGDKEKNVVAFDVFGPKLIATRERFEDKALESRCLTEIMTGTVPKGIPTELDKEFYRLAQVLRNQLLLFRFKYYFKVEYKPEYAIDGVEGRINQIIVPLLSIIESEEEREELVEFAKDSSTQLKQGRSEELQAEVLTVIVDMVKLGERLNNKAISNKLNGTRDKENGEYAISPAKIGRINHTWFNFETRKVNGFTEILWDSKKGKELCARYSVDFVDDVEDIQSTNELSVLAKTILKDDQQPLQETLQGLQTLPTEANNE